MTGELELQRPKAKRLAERSDRYNQNDLFSAFRSLYPGSKLLLNVPHAPA